MNVLWYACAEAEREPDAFVVWHYQGCPLCALKARAQCLRFPDDELVQRILGRVAAVLS